MTIPLSAHLLFRTPVDENLLCSITPLIRVTREASPRRASLLCWTNLVQYQVMHSRFSHGLTLGNEKEPHLHMINQPMLRSRRRISRLLSVYLGLGKGSSLGGLRGSNENGMEIEDASARSAILTEKEKVVLDFHYYNYAFCKERRFDARATSTFLSIMKDILDEVTCFDDAAAGSIGNLSLGAALGYFAFGANYIFINKPRSDKCHQNILEKSRAATNLYRLLHNKFFSGVT